jgi:tetratricopeptide (TPR) repeat protein
VLVIGGSGCVFINTFYNGRVAYQRAYTAHQKLLAARPDSVLTLPSDINADYDSAISKSLKVLDIFHNKEKWQDDALLLMSKALFQKGEYQAARRRLKQLQDEYPQSTLVPESYLYVARCYMNEENFDKADETFALIVARYPQLNKNEEISLLVAQLAVKREGKSMAIQILEKARASIKDEAKKMQLYLQIAGLYMDLGQHEKAIALLKSAPRNKRYAETLYRIDIDLAACYIQTDSLSAALTHVEKMIKTKIYGPHLPAMLVKKGDILDRLGRTDDAIVAFQTVTKGYEQNPSAGEAYYRMAIVYQKKKGDYAKAREYFISAVARLASPELKKIAQERLDAIKELDQIHAADSAARKSVKKDTTARAETSLFRLGEIFWLRLDQPDSALVYYRKLLRDTATSADSIPRALFAAGWISRAILKDTVQSDSFFHELLSKFPASEHAKAAQISAGAKVTVMTVTDSAEAAFIKAENTLFKEENIAAAIESYMAAYHAYPKTSHGIKALYAAAWLNDYVLDKKKTALSLYRTLCDSFPQSEFCTNQAKPRLKTVEDTLRVRNAAKKTQQKDANTKAVQHQKTADTATTELSDVQPAPAAAPAPSQTDSARAIGASQPVAAPASPQTDSARAIAAPQPALPASRPYPDSLMRFRRGYYQQADSARH